MRMEGTGIDISPVAQPDRCVERSLTAAGIDQVAIRYHDTRRISLNGKIGALPLTPLHLKVPCTQAGGNLRFADFSLHRGVHGRRARDIGRPARHWMKDRDQRNQSLEISRAGLNVELRMYADLPFCGNRRRGNAKSGLMQRQYIPWSVINGVNGALDWNVSFRGSLYAAGAPHHEIDSGTDIAHTPSPRRVGCAINQP